MIVDVNEIERCLRYFKDVNDAKLADIVWMRGSEILTPEQELIDAFEFIGLSNRDFPAVAGWLPDGIGIRVKSMTFTKDPNAEVCGAEGIRSTAGLGDEREKG